MTTSKNQDLDLRQTNSYANFLKSQDWIVERVNNINYFIKSFTLQAPLIKKLPIIGSVLKIQRPEKIDFETIQKLEKKYKVFQTIIEPNSTFSNRRFVFNHHNSLLQYGFKLSKNPYLPTKTTIIDLTETKEEIYANFTKDCKYAIRKGRGAKVKKYSTPKEIENFYKAWKNSVNFNRYVPSLRTLLNLKRSFPNNNTIFLASHNISGSIIGGAIFTTSSHGVSNYITYYMYGFTNKEGRTSLSQYSLLYQGILWGKSRGSKFFDMEGIYDSRFPIKSWLGFTHFKKQFGGTEVTYPGCYIKFRFPFHKTN